MTQPRKGQSGSPQSSDLHRETEEALRKARDELEQRVQERTAALTAMIGELHAEVDNRARADKDIQGLAKFPSENPNPVLRIARDGTLLYVNEAGSTLLSEWHLQAGQAVPPMLREIVLQSIDGGSTQVVDLEHRGRVYSLFVAPVAGSGYANLYGRDVTERRRAEEALRESEELYRSLVENLTVGITLIDSNHTIVTISPTQARMFGKSVSEFLGKKCYREFEKREAVCPHCPGVKAMATGETVEVVAEGVRDDGSRFAAVLKALPWRRQDGTALGFIEMVEDVTPKRRAEEKLRESEEWYRTLFVEALDGIGLVDVKTGLLIDCNQALAALVGRDKAELIGQPQTILHPPAKDNGSFSPTFKQHLGDKAGQALDTQVVTRTGEIKEVAIRASRSEEHTSELQSLS